METKTDLMPEATETTIPSETASEPTKPSKQRPGRRPIPPELQRRLVWGRIQPDTEEFLKTLPAANMGRAIDLAVQDLKKFVSNIQDAVDQSKPS